MFEKFFSSFTARSETEVDESKIRRLHPRRSCDSCVSLVNGKIYPVENWSHGGVLLNADDRLFGLNDEVDITMKFKLRGEVMDVPHKAKIIRKNANKIALQFYPISRKIQSAFQKVVDDYVAQQFVDSQTV